MTPVLIKRSQVFARAWKSLERLVRVQEASETWKSTVVAGVATDVLEF
jgi:hypothetical protein